MISQLAIADIEAMQEAGLNPTPTDIVRLNALGLKVEYSAHAGDLYALPRVAYLGEEVFREPTIAHGMWIDRVLEYVNAKDYSTYLAVNAFAISRMPEELPEATDRKRVVREINRYCEKGLGKFTQDQIRCAILYAIHGNDASAREYPADRPKREPDGVPQFPDAPSSVYVGVLYDTLAVSLGLSVADISRMTVSKAKALQAFAFRRMGVDVCKGNVKDAQGDYFITLDEIRTRLGKEKNNG